MKVLNKNCKLGYCRLHIGIRSKPFTMFPCTTRGSVLAKHIATQAQVYFATIEHKHKENKLLTLRLIFTAVALLAIKAAQSPKFFFCTKLFTSCKPLHCSHLELGCSYIS